MTTITYASVNLETGSFCNHGREYDNAPDAFIAALTDGKGTLERDKTGYMRAVEGGKLLYIGGSFNKDDITAKAEAISEIERSLSHKESRFSALKVERDDNGAIVKLDDEADPEAIAYWFPKSAPSSPKRKQTLDTGPGM